MGALNNDRVYALADSLGMALTHDPATDMITGETDKTINLFGSPIKVPTKVVSSLITQAAYMVMVRLIGNLALFVVAKKLHSTTVVDLHVLNLAKMDKVAGWLEREKPASVNDALRKLAPAIVKSFIKVGKTKWTEAA